MTLTMAASPEGAALLKDADIIWATDRERGFVKLLFGKFKSGQMCQSIEIQIDSTKADEFERATRIVAKAQTPAVYHGWGETL